MLQRECPQHRLCLFTKTFCRDVRRAALSHTPPTARTLEAIISRVRDVDDNVRKIVFQNCLPQIPHPRVLTIAQRERVFRTGLGDREPAVKDAAQALAVKWVEILEGDLLRFLDTFDLVGGDVAEQALSAVFEAKPTLLDGLKFDGMLHVWGLDLFIDSLLSSVLVHCDSRKSVPCARIYRLLHCQEE